MKILHSLAACVVIVTRIAACKAMAHDDIRLVEAIAQVESGGADDAVGSLTTRGERALGRYQILPSTWRDRTDWPIEWAHEHHRAQVVAVSHVQWLRTQLEKRLGQGQVTTFHIVMAYRYGASHTTKHDTRDQFYERLQYWERVNNILSIQNPDHQPVLD